MNIVSRSYKVIFLIASDIILIAVALWISLYIRLDDISASLPTGEYQHLYWAYTLVIFCSLLLFQTHRNVLRYSNWEFSKTLLIACLSGSLVTSFIFYITNSIAPPRSSAFLFPFIATLLLYSSRYLMKRRHLGITLLSDLSSFKASFFNSKTMQEKAVAIYGAGEAGQQLLDSLTKASGYDPVVFIDDDPQLNRALIKNTIVIHSSRISSAISNFGIKEILLAIPSATRAQRNAMIHRIQQEHVIPVRTLPTLKDIVMGTVNMTDLKDIDIADVLGRQAIEPDQQIMADAVKGKTIVISGAGGSIGSEICTQVLLYNPARLILIEHSEHNLYQIHRKCISSVQSFAVDTQIYPKLISVTDAPMMLKLLEQYKPDLFFHAAAYKHVPLVEENEYQGFINNCIGTQVSVQACIIAKVPQFILISTDKAVRPTNIMGATKRIAELMLQAYSQCLQISVMDQFQLTHSSFDNQTQCSMVRFGNVLESSGSVIPLFREQIKQGGPITVTDPEITRFFMTIPEAAQLVIQSTQLSQGGDVLLLDMGEPIKIVDLAEQLITLSGLTIQSEQQPNGDIAIKYSGLRPGEKLYEELLIDAINSEQTQHSKIWRANELAMDIDTLTNFLKDLNHAFQQNDKDKVISLLKCTEIGFSIQTT